MTSNVGASELGADLDAAGFFDGLDARARSARTELLTALAKMGIPDEQVRLAAAENRLTLLPAEWSLSRESVLTTAELSERAGVDTDSIVEVVRALGLRPPDPGEAGFREADVAAFASLALMRASGIPKEGVADVSRVLGHALWRISEAIRDLIGETFADPGGSEHELAMRYATLAKELTPHVTPLLESVFRAHLLEGVKSDIVAVAGTGPATRQVGVAFADLVDFSRLGQELSAGELGQIAERLTEMTVAATTPPVRLVKTIGDAVMLVSSELPPLVDATLDLLEAAAREPGLPQLRAGIAYGSAVPRSGDWYGDTVNVASRLSVLAKPDSLLATEAVREVCGASYGWSPLGPRRLKGRRRPMDVYRLRHLSTG